MHYFKAISEFKLKLQSGNTQFRSKLAILLSCVTLKFDRWPWKIIWHFFYFNLYASFRRHRSIQTEVTVWKYPIWIKIGDFMSHVTLKFDGWLWKIIKQLFYVTSSCVFHIIGIGQFKLKLQSGIAKFGWKSTIFLSLGTLKFDGCPWKTIGHLLYTTWSFIALNLPVC